MREEGGEGEAHTGAGEKCEKGGAGGRNCCVLTTTPPDPLLLGVGEVDGFAVKLSLGEWGGKVLL